MNRNRPCPSSIILWVLLPLLTSCAVMESTYSTSKFFFITVDKETTFFMCLFFLILQGTAICLNRFYRKKAGWRHQNVEKNIYNSNHDKIGSYETGEVESWYVSEEKAENDTYTVRYWAEIARITLPRFFLTGCFAGWISAKHPFWAVVIWLAIAPLWSIRRFDKVQNSERTKILEVLYMILLLVCVFVYADY